MKLFLRLGTYFGGCIVVLLAGCGGGGGSSSTPPPAPTTYALTVNSTSPVTGVAITVSPADNAGKTSGTTGFSLTYNAGAAVTLTAPATAPGSKFSAWTGCTSSATVTCNVTLNANTTVTANYVAVPTATVTLTPSASSIASDQSLDVAIAVTAASGNPQPAGTVVLTSGSYTSSTITLSSSGGGALTIPAGALAVGSDTLTGTYTPDTASATTYSTATGKATIAVLQVSTVTVDQSTAGPAVTDQILGMNMAAWYDQITNATAINTAFQTAGIKAMRWPGGSWSDEYHWANNSLCSGTPNSNDTFANVLTSVVKPSGVDLALTANYGTDPTCTKPGDPAEAANWIKAALAQGVKVKYMTVGNEEYGSWETDLHTPKNDATTYANATATGFYQAIKAADPDTLVGVDVNPGSVPEWDSIVLSKAKGKYDFVEYHFYPQGPNSESDTYLVQKAAQDLTRNLNAVKAELVAAGSPNLPIYVGEIGSVYTNPGKQSMSITQALYAGQALGEMMNSGVVRSTWWIGFGGCGDASSGANYSSSIYGWQKFGGYMVFSDGLPEYGCAGAPNIPAGTLLPTARAFQLFSQVAVDGESVLNAAVGGATTDVRAYAATHSGGTALVLFNVNATTSQVVSVKLSGQGASAGVKVSTYDKALYDQSNATTPVWAAPTTSDLGASSLPLRLTLTPWSMNVVIIK